MLIIQLKILGASGVFAGIFTVTVCGWVATSYVPGVTVVGTWDLLLLLPAKVPLHNPRTDNNGFTSWSLPRVPMWCLQQREGARERVHLQSEQGTQLVFAGSWVLVVAANCSLISDRARSERGGHTLSCMHWRWLRLCSQWPPEEGRREPRPPRCAWGTCGARGEGR